MPDLLTYLLDTVEGFRRARLPSLYSDFGAQRFNNADGFVANCNTWLEAISIACRAGMLPSDDPEHEIFSFSTNEDFPSAFESAELGRPLALGAVIDEALGANQLLPYKKFLTTSNLNGRGWARHTWRLLYWALPQVKPFETRSNQINVPVGHFIVTRNLENAADTVVSQLCSRARRLNLVDRIYPILSFREEVGKLLGLDHALSRSDTDIFLKYLSRERGVLDYNENAVVLKSGNDSDQALSIHVDTIALIKGSITDLRRQVELLTTDIMAEDKRVRQALLKRNHSLALSSQRTKKGKEQVLSQRTQTLSQLEVLLSDLAKAADQVTFVKLMRNSSTVMGDLQRQIGTADEISMAIERLEHDHGEVRNMASLLSGINQEELDDDEYQIEQELITLSKESEAIDDTKIVRDVHGKASNELPGAVVSSGRVGSELSGNGSSDLACPDTNPDEIAAGKTPHVKSQDDGDGKLQSSKIAIAS